MVVKKPEVALDIEKYKYFRESLFLTDVSKDEAYQNEFRIFYQMKRFYADSFAREFFKILEALKLESDIKFGDVLR